MATPDSLPGVPQDADDTRARHFRAILAKPVTWTAAGLIAVAVAVALGLALGLAAAGGGAAAVLLLTLLVTWLIANAAARRDFCSAYAESRGLKWHHGHSALPPATPLLRKGDRRYAEEAFEGELPDGPVGRLALYTYVEESRDSSGNKQSTYITFTVALAGLPGAADFIGRLYCQQRRGFRFLDGAEDVFRTSQRVELESEAVDREFEVFAGEHDDMNRVRQLFEPSFLVWLAESAPEDFAFELEAGALCCSVKGHKKSAAELDELSRAAGTVASRVLDEVAE